MLTETKTNHRDDRGLSHKFQYIFKKVCQYEWQSMTSKFYISIGSPYELRNYFKCQLLSGF